MENQENQVSEKDLLTISLKSIPMDLVISIFSRLPVKSIARCRCVSKQWAYILRRRDFTDLFLKISSTRPCLLFAFELNGKMLLFSAPQHQNSSRLVADRHMSFPIENASFGILPPVCGLLCSLDRDPVICNPSTGQYIALRNASLTSKVCTYFGYDPIEKLFKVLRTSKDDYRVLTLGTREPSWRMIECSIPHGSIDSGICIDGVLYYIASNYGTTVHKQPYLLACFDIRLEKFMFFDIDRKIWGSTLINFFGKLGVVHPHEFGFFSTRTTMVELWVLDDVENQKWSKYFYELPSLWKTLVGDNLLDVVGMTGTFDIVFCPFYVTDPFYIIYYNVVKNTVVRVDIQLGIVDPERPIVYTFVDHVQDVKLM